MKELFETIGKISQTILLPEMHNGREVQRGSDQNSLFNLKFDKIRLWQIFSILGFIVFNHEPIATALSFNVVKLVKLGP